MDNVLNSSFVQWCLRWGLTKMGPFVASGVTFFLVHTGASTFLPHDAYVAIQQDLNIGAMALVAWLYAWLMHRQKLGVKVMQEAMNQSQRSGAESVCVKVDGIAGNQSVIGQADVAAVPVEKVLRKLDLPTTGVS